MNSTNNFKVNGNAKRPPLMAELEAAYWADLPLEMIEHGCLPPFEEHWRVTFAVIRCSLCYPHQKPYAVRPRLRSGGFKGWLAALHERAKSKKPIRPGDLNEEMADTDDAGELIQASYADIAQIAGMTERNARRGFQAARKLSLVKEGFPFYANPKPSAVTLKFLKLSPEYFTIARVKLSPEYFPTDPILRARALDWVRGLSAEFKQADQKVNAEFRNRLREGAAEYRILIPQRGRPKSKDTCIEISSSSSISPEEEEEEKLPAQTNAPEPEPEPESLGSFEEVRRNYPPQRMDAGAARTAYQRTVRTPTEHAKLMEGLAKHLACERWRRSLQDDDPAGRFIPLASKFIRERLYLDDPPPYIAKPDDIEADPVIQMLRKEGYR